MPLIPLAPLAVLALAATGALPVPSGEILPLDQVREGMIGRGRTAFRGGAIEEFEVEVLGVLANSAARRSTILARLSGGPLADAGVIAGMSGSPVYVGERLLGAVSSGYLYSKEAIAGITPIESMRAIPAHEGDGSRPEPLYLSAGRPVADRLLALERGRPVAPLGGVAALPDGTAAAGLPDPPLAARLPLLVSGLDPRTAARASDALRRFGLVPLEAAALGRYPGGDPDDLTAGAPVAVELVRGDLEMAAFGTVTERRGDQLLAFGHPLFSAGSVRLPLATARVLAVLPSVASSFKIASVGRTVGALVQDRSTGVLGRIGETAPLVPLAIGVKRGEGPLEDFAFELASHRLLTPLLVELCLGDALLQSEKQAGASSIDLNGRLRLAGRGEVEIDQFFSGDGAAGQAAGTVAAIASLLLDNEFEPATLAGITLTAGYLEDNRFASLDRVWTDRTRVRAGETVVVRARLRAARQGEQAVSLELRVPEGTPAGPLELVVGDAASLARFEARTQRRAPRDLDQLVAALNGLRKASRLHALLVRPGPGLSIGGTRHPGLPLSAYSLLLAGDGEERVTPVVRTTLDEQSVATGWRVSGSQVVRIEVGGSEP